MKKLVVLCFILLFSLSMIPQAQAASLKDKKVEFAKIKQYLMVLDQKIRKARTQKRINKISELKEIKRAELSRAKVLKAEIVKLEAGKPVTTKPTAKAGPARAGGWLVEGGLGCGGGLGRVGYLMPIRANMDLVIDGGLAVGSGFSAVVADVGVRFLVGRGFIGLEAGLASYSKTVTGVPGVSGNIGGSNTGIGIYGGTNFGKIEAKAGYNTAAGLIGTVGYRF